MLDDLNQPLERWRQIASEGSKDFPTLQENATILDELTKMAAEERLKYAPSIRLDPYGSKSLPERIRIYRELSEELAPSKQMHFTKLQQQIVGKMWLKFRKALDEGDTKKAEKALDKISTFRKYWYAVTNTNKYREITALEDHIQEHKSKILDNKKKYVVVKGLEKSIADEQREVARSLAKMEREGYITNMLQIANEQGLLLGDQSDPVLGVISNILEHCPGMQEDVIFNHMQERGISISHRNIFESIKNLNDVVQKQKKEVQGPLEKAEACISAIETVQEDLTKFMHLETEMDIDGRPLPIHRLLTSIQTDDLDETEAAQICAHAAKIRETWATNTTIKFIQTTTKTLQERDFDPDQVPLARIQNTLRSQKLSYAGIRLRAFLANSGVSGIFARHVSHMEHGHTAQHEENPCAPPDHMEHAHAAANDDLVDAPTPLHER